jgi:serine phosphatase RsbU (regulator of sigma subunit)
VVQAHATESADAIADAIFTRAREFASGVLRDDVAIVVIRHEPTQRGS